MASATRPLIRRALAVLVAAQVLSPPLPASATAQLDNSLRTDVTIDDPLVGFYQYGAGSQKSWTDEADYQAGSHNGVVSSAGVLTLERGVASDPDIGFADWWDTEWIVRECFTIGHTRPGATDLIDYPVRFTPTIAPSVDLRAVASDDSTVLPHWVNGTEVWVNVDVVPAGGSTHVCLYSDNPAASDTSDVSGAVLSSLVPSYVTVNERASGRNVVVVSYIDGNVITNGTQTVFGLDAGESFTFTAGNTSETTFKVLGPISSRVIGQAADSLIPLSWAGTEFIFPTRRGTQRISVHAPIADATVTIYRGAAGATVTLKVPAGTAAHTNADSGGRAVIVASDQPVLAAHVTTSSQDAISGYPSTVEDLYGVPSTRHYVSSNADNTSVTVDRSDGNSYSNADVDRFEIWRVNPNGASFGNGPAARLSGSSAIGSLQQADANGLESTTFLPASVLSSQYYLPTQATYVAFACPVPGTVIDIIPQTGSPSSIACAGPGPPHPGKARVGSLAAGTLLRSEAGEAFYAYYQDNPTVDETNLTGPLTGSGYVWPGPDAPTGRPAEGIFRSTGTWTSATFDTGVAGVFGQLSWSGIAPSGTTLRFQIATAPDAAGPFDFVGPDGTAATSYVHPLSGSEIIHYAHDGNRYGRVRAYLSTTASTASPTVDEITVECELPELAHPVAGSGRLTVAAIPGSPALHPLIRVRAGMVGYPPSTARLMHLTDGNLPNLAAATLAIDPYPAAQIHVVDGSLTLPAGPYESFSPPSAYSITLDEETVAAGQSSTLGFLWRMRVGGTASTYVERLVEVTITT